MLSLGGVLDRISLEMTLAPNAKVKTGTSKKRGPNPIELDWRLQVVLLAKVNSDLDQEGTWSLPRSNEVPFMECQGLQCP